MLTVIPAPVSAEPRPDADFDLTAATAIVAVDAAGPVAEYLADVLRAATGYALPVVHDPKPGSIELHIDDKDGYRAEGLFDSFEDERAGCHAITPRATS